MIWFGRVVVGCDWRNKRLPGRENQIWTLRAEGARKLNQLSSDDFRAS